MSKEPAVLRQHAHLQILHGVPIFSHLEPSELMDLYRRTTVKRWYGGAIILGQDEPGRALYILVKGRARVVLFGENGREMTLSTLSPGDFFGEMALLDSKPHSANVLASEDVVLLVLGREAFLEHLHVHPRSALTLLEQMSLRLRRANETISNLALHDVSSRLIRTLLLLAEESGEDRDGGILIRRRPTQQELANMVGTCRETVSRTLSAMARKGLVVSRGRSLFLSPALLHGMQEAA
jgi:CRP-like cAMP-binding protein